MTNFMSFLTGISIGAPDPPVLTRSHAGIFLENTVEKIFILITALLGNLLDGKFRPPEQIFRSRDAAEGNVLLRRNPETPTEQRGEIGSGELSQRAQSRNVDLFRKIPVNVLQDFGKTTFRCGILRQFM